MPCTQSNLDEQTLLFRAALARMTFLSCGEKLQLLKKLDNASNLALLSKDEIESLFCRKIKSAFWEPDSVIKRAERDFLIMQKYGIRQVLYTDDDFPALLREIPQPPFCLFYRGDLSVTKKDCIGIVGTRHPDGAGLEAAFSFAKDCVQNNAAVVSGLAIGIDAAAHKGAVSVSAANTVAVCGCSVDTIYPPANKKLAAAILSGGGCILSEYPPETPPMAWQFPERNRIISGLSKGVMVIEAPGKSGALITADFALEQGRDVCFHPVALEFSKRLEKTIKTEADMFKISAGVQRYISEGAPVYDKASEMLAAVFGGFQQKEFDF